MSVPHDVELNEQALARLHAIAHFEGSDHDPRLLEAAGFDEAIFRSFLAEIGQSQNATAQEIFELRKTADAAFTQHFHKFDQGMAR